MVYSYVAHYSKLIAHEALERTFPSTAAIATISGVIGYWSYSMGMTYSQGRLAEIIASELEKKFGWVGKQAGYYAVAPAVVPWASPYFSTYISIGTSCATSFTLNLIARYVFKIKPDYKDKRLEQPPPKEVKSYLALTNKKKAQALPEEDFDEEDIDEEDNHEEDMAEEKISRKKTNSDPFKLWTGKNKKAESKIAKLRIQQPEESEIEDDGESLLSGECFSRFCS